MASRIASRRRFHVSRAHRARNIDRVRGSQRGPSSLLARLYIIKVVARSELSRSPPGHGALAHKALTLRYLEFGLFLHLADNATLIE
jgi:hypothetical protein